MPAVRLTETAIAAATKRAQVDGARVEVTDAACPGLRVRITPLGARTWVLGCRDANGAARRFKLGQFPEMGISDARTAARTLRGEVARGADPVAKGRAQRQQARDAKAGIGTLTAVLDRYAAQHGKALRSWAEARRRLESVFSPHLERPVALLRRAELQLTADAWASQSSASAAVRYLRPVLKWAAARDLVGADAANLKPPSPVGRRDRVLARAELARLLPILRGAETAYGPAMLFMLLTASRREETAGATWHDVDLEAAIWTIRKTKNGQPHKVPLSRQALGVLHSRGPGKPKDLIFASRAGNALANWDRASKALREAANKSDRPGGLVDHFTRHDLRRTAATLMGELGELPDIIEAALNHTSIRSTLAATYNRSRYRPQVAVALQRLGDCLEGFEAGGAEVVPLRRA